MHYFKYNHPKKTEKEIYKATLAALDKNERKLMKRNNFFNKLAISFLAAITITLLIISFCIAKSYAPKYENLLSFLILIPISQFGIFILGALITLIISALIAIPIYKSASRADKHLNQLCRERLHEISAKACEHILEFYGLREPSIVTKCYDSTDVKFKNKDIVIFECGGEIRIIRSFFGSVNLSENDFGCYAFKNGEFSLSYTEYKGKRAALLDLGEVKFTLAARAKPFAEKLARYDEDGIFLPASKKEKGSSAYYEFSFCKKDMSIDKLTKRGYEHRSEDSLLLHIDNDSRFFEHYMKYFENPHSPDGTGRFYCAGVNYYTAVETKEILSRIEKDAPPYSAPLISWLREAEKYNGFFFLGI